VDAPVSPPTTAAPERAAPTVALADKVAVVAAVPPAPAAPAAPARTPRAAPARPKQDEKKAPIPRIPAGLPSSGL